MKLRSLLSALVAVAFFGTAHVFAADFTFSTVVNDTSLSFNNGGYTNDGSFTVTIVNDVCTAGVYTVNSTPVNNSAPDTSTPPGTNVTTYIGFTAGNYFFGNAGVGQYTLTITQTSTNPGCVNGAQDVSVVTVNEFVAPPVGGKISSINTPTPTHVDMITVEQVQEEVAEDETNEQPTEATLVTENEEDVMTTQEEENMEQVMHMEVCDTETVVAHQEMLMNKMVETTTSTYEDVLGNALTQVKLYLNRYLDKAESETEKNDKVMALVCKIEKVKSTRVEGDYNHIDYLLQYIQDIAILKFVK